MIKINLEDPIGKIKPVHGVGNGPLGALKIDKRKEFSEARIPFSRLHDTEGSYGGGIYVNIHCVFPNFDADVNDPKSYFFEATDIYIKAILDAGTKVFYRLGESIETSKLLKIFVRPPKDYIKWAQICEHIIMHYNDGWANGFHYNIEYWEIWNEPDNPNMWADASPEEYYELYYVTSNYLKNRFPNIKIGGYSASGFYITTREETSDWFKTLVPFMDSFFEYITREDKKSPLDFFSWHCYTTDPKEIGQHARFVDSQLKKYGFENAESILTEWNYANTWDVEDMKKRKSIFGASMTLASIIELQKSSVAAGMYYDAEIRRVSYCGLFDQFSHEPLKPYYALYYFGKLTDIGMEVSNISDEDNIYVVAAYGTGRGYVLITNFSDEDRCEKIIFNRKTTIKSMNVTNSYVTNESISCDYICENTYDLALKPYEMICIEIE